MKTMILAGVALLGIGLASAYACDGAGPVPNTLFTEIPGVLAQARVTTGQTAPVMLAYATTSRGGSKLERKQYDGFIG